MVVLMHVNRNIDKPSHQWIYGNIQWNVSYLKKWIYINIDMSIDV